MLWPGALLLCAALVRTHGDTLNCSERSQAIQDIPRVDASQWSDWAAVASLLESHGAVVLENAVGREAMEQLASELEADRSATFRGEEGSFAGHDITRNSAKPLGESAWARRLAADERILSIVEDYLSPWCKRIRLGAATAMYVEPPEDVYQEPAPPQVAHRDDMLWAASEWVHTADHCSKEPRPAFSVSVMWAISNFTSYNGATKVAVGSHKQCPRTKMPTEDMHFTTATMNPGDAVLTLSLLRNSICSHHVHYRCSGSGGRSMVQVPVRTQILFLMVLINGWLLRAKACSSSTISAGYIPSTTFSMLCRSKSSTRFRKGSSR